MWLIAKSVKKQVRSTESSHIVKTTIRLSHNAVHVYQCIFNRPGVAGAVL